MITDFLFPLISGLAGYLLGSISFAVIVAKRCGVDIFKAGSGNPGATNVKRVCGKKPGNLVFALDLLKGLVAAGLPWVIGTLSGFSPDVIMHAQIAGFAGAVLGHCFSIFLGFRGGKGIAVSAGALLGALLPCCLVAAALWLIIYFSTKVVSIASLLAALSLPVTSYFWYNGAGDPRFWLCCAVAGFVCFTHRGNIARLVSGKENKF